MSRKFQYMIMGACITLLVLGGVFFFVSSSTKASNEASNALITNRNSMAEQDASQGAVEVERADVEQLQTYLTMREALIKKGEDYIKNESGWIHRVTQSERPDEEYGILPNGVTIPGDYLLEDWFFVDDTGLVTTFLGIMRDMNGNIVQVITYREGVLRDFAMGEMYESSPPTLFYTQTVVPEQIVSIFQDEEIMEGQEIVTFTIQDAMSPVALDDMEGVLARGGIRQETFNVTTGQLLRLETILLASDGSEFSLGSSELLTFERVIELPKDLIDVLNQELETGATNDDNS